jgi:hypothetical protein
VLRAGPIPGFLHGVIEYAAGVLLIVAPFLLGFDDGAATAASIVMGVVVIAIAASTAGATGLVDQIAVSVHVVLDYFVVVLLIAIPFIFGFSDEGAPTAFFIALGVTHLLVTIGTRFVRPEAGEGGGAGRGLRRHRSR